MLVERSLLLAAMARVRERCRGRNQKNLNTMIHNSIPLMNHGDQGEKVSTTLHTRFRTSHESRTSSRTINC